MNETVKRIVEILFQDTEMTEEVQAMRLVQLAQRLQDHSNARRIEHECKV